ncbi:MAG: hypothetical protein RQ735_04880 [Flavobacteriaceae bacterium]|nr:hypothetical protein [Flavobacteriaceae bacterium]
MLFIFVIHSGFKPVSHKFYVSVMEIRHDEAKKELQISLSIFWDDWERYLDETQPSDKIVNYQDDSKEATLLFENYLKQHLRFSIDNQPKTFEYLGREYDLDVMYGYLLIKNIETFQAIEIKNTVLTDFIPDQQNIIHLITANGRKSSMTDADKPKAVLKTN